MEKYNLSNFDGINIDFIPHCLKYGIDLSEFTDFVK